MEIHWFIMNTAFSHPHGQSVKRQWEKENEIKWLSLFSVLIN